MLDQQTQRNALPVPHAMTRPDRVPVQRYYDPEFYELERERFWSRTWQMACRLEEIPEPGDFVEYQLMERSVVIVRVTVDEIRAFDNACRHRGVRLVQDRGSIPSGFICPFHGWCYGLDGENTFVFQPDLFDPENLQREDLRLTERRVEVWANCAFINFDDSAPPLRECLEPFATMLDGWKAESLRADKWWSFRLPVNWKLAVEAFMEGYHVMATHPQLLPPSARGKNASYGAGAGRPTMKANQQDSAAISSQQYIDAQITFWREFGIGMGAMVQDKDLAIAASLRDLELPDDPQARAAAWRTTFNDAIVESQRAEGINVPDLNWVFEQGYITNVNFCFPNFFLLPLFGNAASYRIRPLGPEECLFELWSLIRYPEGEVAPRPQRPEPMVPGDPAIPPIPTQDFSNLPIQQIGLHAPGFEYMRLSNKVEGMIGNNQRVIDGFLAGLGYDELVPAMQQVSGGIDRPIADVGF